MTEAVGAGRRRHGGAPSPRPLTPVRRRHSVRAHDAPARARLRLAIALYLVLVFLSFLPQSLRPRDTIAYVGDSLESVYIVAWNVHQLFRSPAHLFDANVLYPASARARLHRSPAAALAGRRARVVGDRQPRPGHERRRRAGLPPRRRWRPPAGRRSSACLRWRPGPRAPSTRSTPTRSTRPRASTSWPTASSRSPWPS